MAGIVEAADTLREGWKKMLRNGRNTLFLLEAWVINELLISSATKDIPTTDIQATVAEY